jgi:hypothetical protein
MARKAQKSSSTILVADGRGGMRRVADNRFAGGAWPIERSIPDNEATNWMGHMRAEAEERNWPATGLGQLDAEENSGSYTIRMGQETDAQTIEIAWEKPRGGAMLLHARAGDPSHIESAHNFVEAVDTRHRERRLHREHRRMPLRYYGLRWEGELWLTPDLRIAPASRRPPALMGPQALIVDALVAGIGRKGVREEFGRLIRELQLVIGPILHLHFEQQQHGQDWVPEINDQRQIVDCRLRAVGYVEMEQIDGMPTAGAVAATVLEEVQRPDLSLRGIRPGIDLAVRVPDDAVELWRAFNEMRPAARKQFLQACNCYEIAQTLWPTQRTAYATFLVVACEALKPQARRYDSANFYDVVNSFLGPEVATNLRSLRLQPQRVRSGHVHRAHLVADELVPMLFADDFRDPSLDQTLSQLARVVRCCLIEWLRRRGVYTLKWAPRPKEAKGGRRGQQRKVRKSKK